MDRRERHVDDDGDDASRGRGDRDGAGDGARAERVRGWVFTINNPTDEDEHWVFNLFNYSSYVVAGRETAPTTGTKHLQGFVYFANQRTFKGVQQLLPHGAHIEPKSERSTFKQCSDYCKKDNDFFEAGILPMDQQAKGEKGKADARERWELAKKGDFESLPPEHYQRYRAIYAQFRLVVDRNELDNLWIQGRSGCGKSRLVRDTYGPGTELGGELGFYSKPMSKWWDGYCEEETVLLDDFDPRHAEFLSYYLKIWSDHYAFNAEVKCGMTKIRPKRIIVTSQYSIEQCFQEPQTVEAINRRFKVIELTKIDNGPMATNFNHK